MLLLATMLLMTISTQLVNTLKITSILHVQIFVKTIARRPKEISLHNNTRVDKKKCGKLSVSFRSTFPLFVALLSIGNPWPSRK
jgi:hypothetical protein